jgi:hypothetical protein
MKKILLGTTAIVAVGMIAAPASAAEKIKLGIGGYMEQYIGFVDAEDDASRTDWAVFDQQSDSEFHLTGSTTLDNGIKFGVKFEIEGDVAGGTQDESVMTISSATLGEVKLGGEDDVGVLTAIGMVEYGIGQGDIDNWLNEGITNIYIDPHIGLWSDENKVSYLSPRFFGLQVAGSYIPEAGASAGGGVLPNRTTDNGSAYVLAANYKETFGSVAVGVSYAYNHYSSFTAAPNNSMNGHAVGAEVGVAGFKVGGAFVRVDDQYSPIAIGTTTSNDGYMWQIGVGYTTGPLKVSAGYVTSELEGRRNLAGEDEADQFIVSGNYLLGPGVEARGSVFWADYDDETANNDQLEEGGGWGIVLGIDLSF